MNKHTKPFSDTFFWGAATAAHQVEGNNHNQWTAWELKTANEKAVVAPERFKDFPIWDSIKDQAVIPETYISGTLMDHFNNYETDFELLTDMNMNAYRFSIEWSRIETAKGVWDEAAIEHYRQYISTLKRRGVEPLVTLFHFSLPEWFSEIGSFEKKKNVHYFLRFVEKIMSEVGQDLRYVITINEPEVYVDEGYIACHFPPQTRSLTKAWRVFRNLAYAHNRAAAIIHKAHPHLKVSIAKNSACYFAGDKRLISRLFVRLRYYIRDDYFMKRVHSHCDFLGVNYYFSNRVIGSRIVNTNERVHDLGWNLAPADIEHVITRFSNKYRLPIIITENGLADQNDTQRQWWIEETIKGMSRAQNNGAELFGYIHWSLFDNFEWGFGTIPRFGLASVDYDTNEKKLRLSAIWFGEYIKKMRQAEDMSQATSR